MTISMWPEKVGGPKSKFISNSKTMHFLVKLMKHRYRWHLFNVMCVHTFALNCNLQYFVILKCNKLCCVLYTSIWYLSLYSFIVFKSWPWSQFTSPATLWWIILWLMARKYFYRYIFLLPSWFHFPPLWLTLRFSHHRMNHCCDCRRSQRSSRRPTHTTLTKPSSTTRSTRRFGTWRRL